MSQTLLIPVRDIDQDEIIPTGFEGISYRLGSVSITERWLGEVKQCLQRFVTWFRRLSPPSKLVILIALRPLLFAIGLMALTTTFSGSMKPKTPKEENSFSSVNSGSPFYQRMENEF